MKATIIDGKLTITAENKIQSESLRKWWDNNKYLNGINTILDISNEYDIDINQIDNLQIGWNGTPDYPELSNGYIETCDINGVEASEEEVEFINENYIGDFYDEIYESLIP